MNPTIYTIDYSDNYNQDGGLSFNFNIGSKSPTMSLEYKMVLFGRTEDLLKVKSEVSKTESVIKTHVDIENKFPNMRFYRLDLVESSPDTSLLLSYKNSGQVLSKLTAIKEKGSQIQGGIQLLKQKTNLANLSQLKSNVMGSPSEEYKKLNLPKYLVSIDTIANPYNNSEITESLQLIRTLYTDNNSYVETRKQQINKIIEGIDDLNNLKNIVIPTLEKQTLELKKKIVLTSKSINNKIPKKITLTGRKLKDIINDTEFKNFISKIIPLILGFSYNTQFGYLLLSGSISQEGKLLRTTTKYGKLSVATAFDTITECLYNTGDDCINDDATITQKKQELESLNTIPKPVIQ